MIQWIHALFLVLGTQSVQTLSVEDAWIREGPPGNRMLAGYLTLLNQGESETRLMSVEGEDFAAVSVHRTTVEDGISRMKEVNRLEVPAGESVEFRPGGLHLMLMGPMRPLREGDISRLVFHFENRVELEVEFQVRRNH